MTQTLAIAESVTSLAQVESMFNLKPAPDDRFFSEWSERLPLLSDSDRIRLDLTKQRYLYHRKYGHLAESTVNFVVISPLLELAGFYDPPFLLRSEVPVELTIEEAGETLKGRIDNLVILDRLWVLLSESKQTSFNVDVAIPQALTYMMSNPHPDRPGFGLVSNGGYFIFLKVDIATGTYALSEDFSLYRKQNELFGVLAALQKLGQLILL
jgi:hypothetical protein